VAAQWTELERFARETSKLPTVFVLGIAVAVGGRIFNSAAVVHGGRILGIVPKEKLPTYNVFYEARTFSRGGPGLSLDADGVPLGDFVFAFDFGTVGVEVCEDAWAPDGPWFSAVASCASAHSHSPMSVCRRPSRPSSRRSARKAWVSGYVRCRAWSSR